MTVGQMAKALVGALIAGLTALGTALADGEVTQGEWVGVAVAALGVLGGVFYTENADDPPDRS
jgi:hypothetical protein